MAKQSRKATPTDDPAPTPTPVAAAPDKQLMPAEPEQSAPDSNLDPKDFLWKVVGRFDFYIGTTNTKAGFLIAFNAFVVTGIVLKWSDLRGLHGNHAPFAADFTSVLLALATLASLVSLLFTFVAVHPFLSSHKDPDDYSSAIFFGHVAQYDEPEKYRLKVRGQTEENVVKDLAFQAHILAHGLSSKFKWLKYAIWVVVFAQLPALGLLVITILVALIADRYIG